jgi:hypothetical protein|tara:strand:+ start:59 stop:673 length:615 start_codon:yes stop_codon:yes gene_type:complete
MYKIHAVQCQDYAMQSADNLMDVAMLVSVSIQQNWLSCGNQLADVRKNGIDSKFLWGVKSKTYKYLNSNKHKLYAQAKAIANSNKTDDDKAYSLMKVFLRVDGLGLPKAGFMCQLTMGLVGCMDVHNIKMYELDPKTFTLAKNPKTIKGLTANRNKIEGYISLCHRHGTEKLWDEWCNNLATKSIKWRDGNHVSEVHINYLLGV